MIFLNDSFFSDADNLISPPTDIGQVSTVTIKNSIVSELYMTRDTGFSLSDTIPEWGYDTLIHAIYEGNIQGGNTDYGVDNTTDILIKRREKGTFKWLTIFHKVITSINDFIVVTYDKYCKSNTSYEYALVPVNNTVESTYNIAECECKFCGMYLMTKDTVFECLLDIKIDFQKNAPQAILKPLNATKPRLVNTSKQNYESGQVSITAIQRKDCDFDLNNAWKYREDFMSFLVSRKVVIMKTFDGQLKLIRILDQPGQSQKNHWNAPQTSWSYMEVGDITNRDLYNFDLLDVAEEWWVI